MSAWRAEMEATVGTFELDVALEGDASVLALIGPNGSGKTTCLRALAGAVEVERAEIVVGGQVLTSTHQGIHLAIEERRVGYVPQGYGLFPHLNVLDNVAFGLSTGPGKLARAERHGKAHAILEELGCAALAHRRVSRLSGGEKQRVALARALVIEPGILLLDEPLAALDAVTRRAVRGFLADRLAAFGRPTVLVTHDMRDVAALNAQVCVLENGRIVQRGDLASLQASPGTDFVAEFCAATTTSTSRRASSRAGLAD